MSDVNRYPHQLRVALSGGGYVVLAADFDVWHMPEKDRAFVFGLVDQITAYRDEHEIQLEQERAQLLAATATKGGE